jgi:hypothetical protein
MSRLPPAVVYLAIPLLFLQATPVNDTENRCSVDDNDAYNGYSWLADQSVCVPGLVTVKTWYMPAPPYAFGRAVWYDPYIMEATARYRKLDLNDFVGGVALMSPSDIGRTVWLRRPGLDWEGPFLVVDSARRSDIWPVVMHRREIVEVDFETAVRWGMVTATKQEDGNFGRPYWVRQWRIEGVEVLKMDEVPPWISNHKPVDYVQWWSERAVLVNPRDMKRPYQLEPSDPKFPGWKWMGTDPPTHLNAYDNWFEFLFPGDSRFHFDLPDNYRAPELWIIGCVLNLDCPDLWDLLR